MAEASRQEIKLFYCYAREDRDLRDQFEKSLSGLKRHYRLGNWYDREILAGQDWEKSVAEQLSSANIIFLLISPDFIASDYCYGVEMQRALERHREGNCLVIPILLRPTHWEGEPFGNLQLLPTDAKPITRWPDRDDAFQDVVKAISLVLKDLHILLKTKKDWLDEGTSFRNLKLYDSALEAFKVALRLDPNYIEAYKEMGLTFLDHGRYEEALEAFEQAIRLGPNLVSAYIGRDKVLQQLGISRKAQEELVAQLEYARKGWNETLSQLDIAKEAQEQLARQLQRTRKELLSQQKRSKQLKGQLEQAGQQLKEQQKRVKQLEEQLVQIQQKYEELQQDSYIIEDYNTARRIREAAQAGYPTSPFEDEIEEFPPIPLPEQRIKKNH